MRENKRCEFCSVRSVCVSGLWTFVPSFCSESQQEECALTDREGGESELDMAAKAGG